MSAPAGSTLRLAEVLGALSLATDIANGQAAEHGLRLALLASRLVHDQPLAIRRDVYWTGLLRYLGCNAFAMEEARWSAGDDIALRASFLVHDIGRPREFMRAAFTDLGRGAPLAQRIGAVPSILSTPSAPLAHAHAQCDAALHCGRKLA